MKRKDLPLGVQNFEIMRTGNFVYVDKTKWIYKLLQRNQAFYFMSRPRRFGKSLLVSTFASLFEGKKELFEGLWIAENTDYSWDKHPVVVIDFNGICNRTPEELETDLLDLIDEIFKKHGLSVVQETTSLSRRFRNLITSLYEKYNQPVAILVDEYDKPIISHIGKDEELSSIAKRNRDILKQLFGVLKDYEVEKCLRFVFITGVSKFARVSIFSDLNNLSDLTMLPPYGVLLGYTREELTESFLPYIEELADTHNISVDTCFDKMKTWYNGYRFTKLMDNVYNPFSILSVLINQDFKNYWFETGTPTFLVNLIKENDYPVDSLEYISLDEETFSSYDIDDLRIEALLFQTGYLTITGYDDIFYTLNYPNQEVKASFLKFFYHHMVSIKSSGTKDSFKLLAKYLRLEELEDFVDTVNTILSSITYQQIAKQDEAYFHTVFYLMLSATGVDVLTEVLTSRGRMDMAVFFPDKIYIIELKCNKSAAHGIEQIKKQGYPDRYKADGKRIILGGINFDTDKREIVDWKFEE